MPRFKDSARRARHSRAVAAHTTTLDVRQLPLWRRLPAILAAFDGLAPGDAIVVRVAEGRVEARVTDVAES